MKYMIFIVVYDALCDRYTDYIGVNNIYYLNNV